MTGFRNVIHVLFAVLAVLVLLALPAGAQNVRPPDDAVRDVQTEAQGTTSDTDFWQAIRNGEAGNVSIPDRQAGQLIQSEGELWRNWRNGPITIYGALALLGMIAALSLFFVLRGRIRIEHGASGITIERFNTLERFGHWLMASSFVILALSGLNMLFGRYVLLPLIGKPAFASIAMWGKYLHNYLAFAFMAGVALVFVLWVKDNFPNRHDLVWLAKGGGLFSTGVHPPSRKFNAGQKIIFWLVVLLTVSVSLSGIALMFPFETAFMAKTFALINVFGYDLPTGLSAIEEQQLNQIWHGIAGLAFMTVIIAHIYIGSVGMEGGFDAMGSGHVDLNWAREHHNLWVEELETEGRLHVDGPRVEAGAQPAE